MAETRTTNGRPTPTLTWIAGFMATIMAAGIPWAFSLHGRLSSIETKLSTMEIPPAWFIDDVADIESAVNRIEDRMTQLEDDR